MYDGRHTYDHMSTSDQSHSRTSVGTARQRVRNDARSNYDHRSPTYRDHQSASRLNGWPSELSPVPSPERPSSRLVYDGRQRPRPITPSNTGQVTTGGERDFLVKVQRELEDQRESWRSEIDRLSRSTVQLDAEDRLPSLEYFPNGGGRSSSSSTDAGTNSYVDTSGRVPLFKAFVDVSEFDAGDVRVTVDKLADKIVVQARQPPIGAAGVSRSFTQRVQLPRFADDARLVARMNHRGILKLEVPLVYYFPPEDRDITRDGRAKSFVYEIRDDPTDRSRQLMEILVNTGHDVGADQLRVEVDDDAGLLITADKPEPSGRGPPRRHVIKRYTLPPLADVDGITSRFGMDGRLTILIPFRRR